MNRLHLILLLSGAGCWALASAAGCDRGASRLVSRARMEQGLTLVLPGVEGRGYLNREIRNGLADGGVPTAIRIHDWTLGPMMALVNQRMETRARRKGEELAAVILAYKDLHPDRPIFLVSHSGGCAVALFATEALPPRQTIDSIIMLGPSISPDYDMTEALRRVDSRAICYFSPKDRGFLGVGTWVFGTMDGAHSSSAGRTGFRIPPTASVETLHHYDKLEQIEWSPSMRRSGNNGGHTDWADRRFVRDYVATQVKRRMRKLADGPATRPAQPQPDRPPTTPILVRRPAGPPATTQPDATALGYGTSTKTTPRPPDLYWP